MPAKYMELDLGTRVVFPEGYDCYPHFLFKERLEGQVVSLHDHYVAVRLDVVKEELEEWDNCIHAYCEDWGKEEVPDSVLEIPGLEVLH